MGNAFSDFAGGFLGQGPGTDTVSGYDLLNTEKRQGLDALRHFGYQMFEPGGPGMKGWAYEALPGQERERRVGELGDVYKAQFNPFLQRVMSEAEGNLSKAGLYSSGRAGYLKGKLGSDLALSSMLPTVQYKHQLEDTNRAETLRNQLAILDRMLGTDYPGQVEIGKPTSVERGFGSNFGQGLMNSLSGKASAGGSGSGTPIQSGNIPGLQGGMPFSDYKPDGGGGDFMSMAMKFLPFLI